MRVFTINRALAELLRSTVTAIGGQVPPNLLVAALYDFLLDAICLFEARSKYRLVDERSRERIVISWRDFCNHRGRDARQNAFAAKQVRNLIRSIESRAIARGRKPTKERPATGIRAFRLWKQGGWGRHTL